MKLAMGAFLAILMTAKVGAAQTNDTSDPNGAATPSKVSQTSKADYTVMGATPAQEETVRRQIRLTRPEVLPARIIFVPHWKYLDNARIFQLHIPTGFASVMFTHLPSRTVFIDNDRYLGEEWLGYWMAHELGHLTLNSPKEDDAERVAKKLRVILKASSVSSKKS